MIGIRTLRTVRTAVVGAVLLVALAACQPTFTGAQFRDFYDRYEPAPNTLVLAGPPPITGNPTADARIRSIAERRGYKLRPVHVGPLITVAGVPLDPAAGTAFAAMIEGARRAGYGLGAISGYRSVDGQRTLFLGFVGRSTAEIANGSADGSVDVALQRAAPPGYSKHQTGSTIDLRAGGPAGPFVNSSVSRWLSADNYQVAKSYGFVPSYPSGAGAQGPEPEPWEYVYVGTQALACSPWLVNNNDKTTFDLCRYPTAISDKYFSLGGPDGFLSRLTAPESDAPGGRSARFANGHIYWSFWTGAHEVHGAILSEYQVTGGPGGVLGFPATDELASAEGGRASGFERGTIYFRWWGGSVTVAGPFADALARAGGVTGPLGYPSARATGDGTAYLQEFDGGRVYLLGGGQPWSVSGLFWNRFASQGGPAGPLGYPTGAVVGGAQGRSYDQPFQHGRIYALAPDRVWAVAGSFWDAYQAAGGSDGSLGMPTGNAVADTGSASFSQPFEGGTLRRSAGGQVTLVTAP